MSDEQLAMRRKSSPGRWMYKYKSPEVHKPSMFSRGNEDAEGQDDRNGKHDEITEIGSS